MIIIIDDARCVAGLLQAPKNARICYVLAHGAGAGMSHPFMVAVADGLAERGIATLRYQFPYMEHGSKRPDAPKLAQATVRAAVAQASHMLPKLGLVAGGKSFGGRMTSRAHANPHCPECEDSHSSDSPCMPQGGHPRSAEHTYLRWRFRCFSCKEPVMRSQTRMSWKSWSNGSARVRPSSCFPMPIIPFTCPRAAGVKTRRSEPSYWIR